MDRIKKLIANKKVLISIIAGAVVLVCVVLGVIFINPTDNDGSVTTTTTTTTIPACKHDDPERIIIVEAKEPTCIEIGLTEGMKCLNCDTMVLPQTLLQVVDCVESDWIIDKEATHTEDGIKHTECVMCGRLFEETIILAGQKELEFTLLDDETYQISGIGNCKDTFVVIPSKHYDISVTSIGNWAFAHGCAFLTDISIPDSVTNIGNYAFFGCNSLESVIMSNTVKNIGNSAFRNCTSLTSITIPNSVTSIGNIAFADCDSLSDVYYLGTPEEWLSISFVDSRANPTNNGANLYCNNILVTQINVPNSITNIDDHAFIGCVSLASITIPNSVTSIGEESFCDCTSLASITFRENSCLRSIGWAAFWNCTSLKSIVIPSCVTSIGGVAFGNCTSLKSIVIPSCVMSIGDGAFVNCSSLTSITFDGTVEQWNDIEKGSNWNYDVPATEVICSNGTVSLK